jgi:hypothetical protein
MRKLLLSGLFLTGAMIFSSSCRMNTLKGEGAKGSVSPAVSAFNAIEIELPVSAAITLKDGSQPGVQLNGYENVIRHIKTKVQNNTLHVYSDLDETWNIDCKGITLQITLPTLEAVKLSGAPDAEIHGTITGHKFSADISGAGKVAIDNINVDNFSTEVSGAGSVEVRGGMVKNATYEISGAGKISAFPLQVNEATASISGAGKGEVTAQQRLTASVSGAGAIKYKGHPAITKDVSGAGSISDAN